MEDGLTMRYKSSQGMNITTNYMEIIPPPVPKRVEYKNPDRLKAFALRALYVVLVAASGLATIALAIIIALSIGDVGPHTVLIAIIMFYLWLMFKMGVLDEWKYRFPSTKKYLTKYIYEED